jgi:hypothetical protein
LRSITVQIHFQNIISGTCRITALIRNNGLVMCITGKRKR